jgi:Flp pilus assembly protein TadD
MTAQIKGTSLTTKFGASVVGLLMAVSAQSADAAEAQSPYVMTVIADMAQGEQVVSGQYEDAIAAITSPNTRNRDSFAASNNLCVAYTKMNDLTKATAACADALQVSKNTFGPWYDASRMRSDRALALSNRGVIRAITGDDSGARQDFELAIKLGKNLSAPLENLARLETGASETVSSL